MNQPARRLSRYSWRPADPLRRAVLFINPRPGDGKAARAKLAERARDRRIQAFTLDPGQDLATLAGEIPGIQDRVPRSRRAGRNWSSTSLVTNVCWDRSSARQASNTSAGVRPAGPRLHSPMWTRRNRPPIRFIANSS